MRKFIKNRLKNERGLTLVELLAVIVILAIVGAIAFVMIGNIIENSKKDAHVANAMQLIDAAKLYEANGNEIGTVDLDTLQSEGLLGELIDPWDKKEYDKAEVTKEKGEDKTVYKVTLKVEGGNCNIEGDDNSEADLIDKGRDICD